MHRPRLLLMDAAGPAMRYLSDTPFFLFFTGKGGVGKTSHACASAVRLANEGKRVLLVSTDPASNVGQVFGVAIGHGITPVGAVPGLDAIEIDPQAAAAQYRERIVGPVRAALPASVIQGIEEQLSGACTTEIAAFDEFTSLLTSPELLGSYDHVVFDTAPTGHTIRMLQLPGAWSGYLEAGQGDVSCLGPVSGLRQQRAKYEAAVAVLADPSRTRLVLVARAQEAALAEAVRTHRELAAVGLSQQHLVINGVFPADEAHGDPLAQAILAREQHAIAAMPAEIAALPADRVPLLADNLVGLAALRALLNPAHAVAPTAASRAPLHAPNLASLVDAIEADGHGLVMLTGKGGVGKTTLAAAIAVALAERGHAVHLTTSDPAAHIAETVQGTAPGLEASRIDPRAETERYRQHVLATKGKALDEQGRAMLDEDLRSPCTEEIAVFQAFSRTVREAGRKFVVMDTAPTGHTLLLLDATGAYHREIARQMGDKGMHYTTPLMQLQNPRLTKVIIATLAETTPVLEAASLQADLRRAGIEPWAWIVNQSLAMTVTLAPLLRKRAEIELPQVAAVAAHARRWAGVPLLPAPPVGLDRLRELASRKQEEENER